ncbi:MAG TPA: dockerin type I domain-containing protein [Pirellulales bacterium]|nr:dockerin type I domain-containing protein [Pirellulales bacterium]
MHTRSGGRSIVCDVIPALTVAVTLFGGAIDSARADDNSFHYLAADPSLQTNLINATLVNGQATYVGEVLSLNQPSEGGLIMNYPGDVVEDPTTGQWRMYYEVRQGQSDNTFLAMATSSDGIHWTKPDLNITGTTYTTNPVNNFVNLPDKFVTGPSVFIDPTAPASERYRMTATTNVYDSHGQFEGLSLNAYSSADGLYWQKSGVIQTALGWQQGIYALDSQNTAFWDPSKHEYVAYMRQWLSPSGSAGERRAVMMATSTTWGSNWTTPTTVVDPANVPALASGSNPADIYVPGVVPYKGQYIGLPSTYFHPAGQADGPLFPTFMYSRDGANWSFPNAQQSILNLSPYGQPGSSFGQAYMASSIPESGGNLYLYYTYFPEQHNTTPQSSGGMYLETIKEDRFEGILSTGNQQGMWTTPAITIPTGGDLHLILNATVTGALSVVILDPKTLLPMPGFGPATALTIAPGDYLDQMAQWSGTNSLAALAGKSVEIRFVMTNATVYSFHSGLAPGDLNDDGTTDLADYSILKSEWMQTGLGLAADLNGDGVVNLADFLRFKTDYQAFALGGASALAVPIPEPSSWMLLVVGLFGWQHFARGNCRKSR